MAEIDGVRKGELLAIREFGINDGPGSTYPSFDKSGNLLRVPGEAILWQRSAYQPNCVRTSGSISECVWTLPGTTALTITNRRLVFSCRKYNADDEWPDGWGINPVGIALAGLVRAVRGFRLAKARQGTTAAGQVRFEWPTSVELGGRRTADWTRLFVCWRDEHTPFNLDLPLGTPVSRQVAELLTALIAKYRLAHRHQLRIENDAWNLLNQQAVRPIEKATADGSVYELPGSVACPTVVGDSPE